MVRESSKFTDKLDFLKASERLESVAKKTNIIYSEKFSKLYNNEVYLKPENLQKTGAFKIRGAYNKISKMSEEDKEKGIISASAGNHAQGVAYSANKLGVKATIVMPTTTPLIKVEGTKKYGVEVVLYGDVYDEAYGHALKLSEERGLVFVHPFEDIDVIEGQGTIGLEILQQLPSCDIIIVPIGGGGLISGVAVAAKRMNPNIKIIGAEPEGASCMKQSLESGEVVCLNTVSTIADGVAVKEPGKMTYEIVKDYVDEIITVSDYETMEAFIEIMESHKLIAESSGALPLAAARKIKVKGKKVCCIVSGGNIDMVSISSMVQKGLVAKGRVFGFSILLPDRPGELVNVAKILAEMGANVIEVQHNQFRTLDRLQDVVLEVHAEANGHDHIHKIIDYFYEKGYQVKMTY